MWINSANIWVNLCQTLWGKLITMRSQVSKILYTGPRIHVLRQWHLHGIGRFMIPWNFIQNLVYKFPYTFKKNKFWRVGKPVPKWIIASVDIHNCKKKKILLSPLSRWIIIKLGIVELRMTESQLIYLIFSKKENQYTTFFDVLWTWKKNVFHL